MKLLRTILPLALIATLGGLAACNHTSTPQRPGNLVGTHWVGTVLDSVSIDSTIHPIELLAVIRFTSDSTASMTMEVSVDGQHDGQESAALTYIYDGTQGTFTDPADGNVVDFVHDSATRTLTYDLPLHLAGQRIGGTFVMQQR